MSEFMQRFAARAAENRAQEARERQLEAAKPDLPKAVTSDIAYAYAADITKAERDENGDLIVYGKATGPDRDLDGDRCDPAWLKRAMPKWFEWGNIREMHGPVLAGIGLELTQDGDDWHVKSKCIDAGVARKLEEGGYKGYSIGIKSGVRKMVDGQAWITDGEIVEVSYVDRPCNPTAKIAIAKAVNGSLETCEIEPVTGEEGKGLVPEAVAQHARRSAEDGDRQQAGDDDPEAANDHDGNERNTGDQESAKPGAQTDPSSQTPGKKKPGKGKRKHTTSKLAPAERQAVMALMTKALDQRKAKESAQSGSDVQGAMGAVKLIAQLIISEAKDLAKGQLHETYDIQCLMDAVQALKTFMSAEEGAMDIRNMGAEPDDTKAVEETPADPQTPEADTAKSAEGTTATIAEMVKAAVAEATKGLEESNTALKAELATLKAQPVPGGPVLLTQAGAQPPKKDDNITKAAEYRKRAKNLDPALAADYIAAADALERSAPEE